MLSHKTRAFEEISWYLRDVDEAAQRRIVRALADRYEVDGRRLRAPGDASDPLVTIGAHTKGHFAVSKLTEERAT